MHETTPLPPTFSGVVELRPSFTPRARISHVVFDFDGTLSWVRHGWPELMLSLFRRYLPAVSDEPHQTTEQLLSDIVIGLNGRPSIVQMEHFARLVLTRGGPSLDPESLRSEFQDQLDTAITARLGSIRSGGVAPDAFVVFGGRALLSHLRACEVTPVILSSTIENRVREEAQALDLAHFFGRHIYGSPPDARQFSKLAVLQRLLSEEGISGESLLSFGDGPVEISATKEIGGLAIAVCSDEEENGSGRMDLLKRAQLFEAGADAAIPDFRDAISLFDFVRGK
jgi:phosphoglycolate phosphatase-like HAD superfamily hydrolase